MLDFELWWSGVGYISLTAVFTLYINNFPFLKSIFMSFIVTKSCSIYVNNWRCIFISLSSIIPPWIYYFFLFISGCSGMEFHPCFEFLSGFISSHLEHFICSSNSLSKSYFKQFVLNLTHHFINSINSFKKVSPK